MNSGYGILLNFINVCQHCCRCDWHICGVYVWNWIVLEGY